MKSLQRCISLSLTFVCWCFPSFLEAPDIRLSDGPHRCAGRVEILHKNVWGTVCDDGWDLNDALVVCRYLGCGTALSVTRSPVFGEGSGPIWLADVNCNGTENSIGKCETKPWAVRKCHHFEDAGVVCTGKMHGSISRGGFKLM